MWGPIAQLPDRTRSVANIPPSTRRDGDPDSAVDLTSTGLGGTRADAGDSRRSSATTNPLGRPRAELLAWRGGARAGGGDARRSSAATNPIARPRSDLLSCGENARLLLL